jgi:diadenosine tetraphosphate (Ap4A) HIT family hydrolase
LPSDSSSEIAAWPKDWQERKAGINCAMCSAVAAGPPDDMVGVSELRRSIVWLPKHSRLPGYCVVVWRGPHVAEPTELDQQSVIDYCLDVVAVSAAIQAVFAPVKMNVLTLGNQTPHLHSHVLPRYEGDPSPGRPLAWEDMFHAEPTEMSILHRQRDLLRGKLQQ